MGVYIKGVSKRELKDIFGKARISYNDIDLVEIKPPHGRLIDEDAFSDKWSGNHIGDEDEHRYHDAQWIDRDEVDKVSTVIEAEVE